MVLWFGGDEYEGLVFGEAYTIVDNVLRDPDGEVIPYKKIPVGHISDMTEILRCLVDSEQDSQDDDEITYGKNVHVTHKYCS